MAHAKRTEEEPVSGVGLRERHPLLIKAVLPALLYLGLYRALTALCGIGFDGLFRAWGLNTKTLALAPLWARSIVSAHTGLSCALSALCAFAAANVFTGKKLFGRAPSVRGILKGKWPALGIAVSVAAVSILADSMRFVSKTPMITVGQLGALLAQILVYGCEAAVLYRILYQSFADTGRPILGGAVTALFSLCFCNNVVMMPNRLLLTAVSLLFADQYGFDAAFGFAATLRGFGTRLVCWPGQAVYYPGIWTLYSVSEPLLTGGENSMLAGLWMSLALIVTGAVMLTTRRRKERHHA